MCQANELKGKGSRHAQKSVGSQKFRPLDPRSKSAFARKLGRWKSPALWGLSTSFVLRPPGWGNDEREDYRRCHHPRDHMECSTIGATDLLHVSDEQRPKSASETPGGEHETINGTDILRSKVISRKGRHGPKSSAIAHEHEEGDDRQ